MPVPTVSKLPELNIPWTPWSSIFFLNLRQIGQFFLPILDPWTCKWEIILKNVIFIACKWCKICKYYVKRKEKKCIWVKYFIYAVLSQFKICRHLRVFPPNLYFQNLRVHKKRFFPSLGDPLLKSQIFRRSRHHLLYKQDNWLYLAEGSWTHCRMVFD